MTHEFRSFRVEVVVIRHYDYGEADRMLTVYSQQRGKLRALAKGVRKVRSRKAGHLEPFTRVKLQLAKGKNWYVVSQAEALDTYSSLRENLEAVGYASYVVELLDKFTYEEEENGAVYRLVTNTLARLARGDEPQMVVRYFEIQLLDLLGFRPEMQNCVVSGSPIKPEDQYFSGKLGGAVSPVYGKGLAGAIPVSMQALKYMRHFQRSPYREAVRAKISDEINQELEILMQHYVTYLLERGLNTPKFIRRVRRDNQISAALSLEDSHD